jgi:hypothetical protein
MTSVFFSGEFVEIAFEKGVLAPVVGARKRYYCLICLLILLLLTKRIEKGSSKTALLGPSWAKSCILCIFLGLSHGVLIASIARNCYLYLHEIGDHHIHETTTSIERIPCLRL